MRPPALALLALFLIAAPARADVLDEFIEEQRIEEEDETTAPPREDAGSAVDSANADQRCVERAIEAGLSPEATDE